MALTSFDLDGVSVEYDPRRTTVVTDTATNGERKRGREFTALVLHRDFEFRLLVRTWQDGTGEIVPVCIRGNADALSLHGRLRLSLEPAPADCYPGKSMVSLRQARLHAAAAVAHSNLYTASLTMLDDGCEFDVAASLLNFGAIAVGTKEQVLGTTGRNRNQCCAVFDRRNYEVPILAFILTRVLPLHRGWLVP